MDAMLTKKIIIKSVQQSTSRQQSLYIQKSDTYKYNSQDLCIHYESGDLKNLVERGHTSEENVSIYIYT